MEIEFNEDEVKCIKCLAKAYATGAGRADLQKEDWETVGVTADNYISVISIMEECGFISGAFHAHRRFLMFAIEPKVLIAARAVEANELEEAKGKDIVESIKVTLRRHPITARLFIAFTGVGAFLIVLHNFMAVLQDFKLIAK